MIVCGRFDLRLARISSWYITMASYQLMLICKAKKNRWYVLLHCGNYFPKLACTSSQFGLFFWILSNISICKKIQPLQPKTKSKYSSIHLINPFYKHYFHLSYKDDTQNPKMYWTIPILSLILTQKKKKLPFP